MTKLLGGSGHQAQMDGQHRFDIQLDLLRQHRRSAFGTDCDHNRIAIDDSRRDEVTNVRTVNHIDPNSRLVRQLRNTHIIVVTFAGGVNQASRLQVGHIAGPCLQLQSALITPLQHDRRRLLTEQNDFGCGFQ